MNAHDPAAHHAAAEHEPTVKDPVLGMNVIPGKAKGGSYAFGGRLSLLQPEVPREA